MPRMNSMQRIYKYLLVINDNEIVIGDSRLVKILILNIDKNLKIEFLNSGSDLTISRMENSRSHMCATLSINILIIFTLQNLCFKD